MSGTGSVLSRFRRPRRRRDTPRGTATVIRGAVIVAIAGAVLFFLLRLYNGLPTTDYEEYYISVPNVGNLLPHDTVRVAGKRVGQVLDIDLSEDGMPTAELQLDPGTKLPTDTEVKLRANGLLGARFVELLPGDEKQLLAEGATIRGGADSYTFGLPEFVEVFDQQARGGLQETVGGLADGLLANGEGLNYTIEYAGERTDDFDRIMKAILARDEAAARLIPALESAFEPLDRNKQVNGPFLDAMADALGPFVTEREAVQATLERAPAALSASEDGLRRGEALLSAVRSFSSAAAETLPYAPEGFSDLSKFLRESAPTLRRAVHPLELTEVGALGLRDLLVALDPVSKHIRRGAEAARPILRHVGKYGCDTINAAAVLRSMTGFAQAGDSYTGPNGPAMAFRLEALPAFPLETVGIADPQVKRDAYEPPCKYLSEPYPQFGGLAALREGQ